jgi:hypothetical protein
MRRKYIARTVTVDVPASDGRPPSGAARSARGRTLGAGEGPLITLEERPEDRTYHGFMESSGEGDWRPDGWADWSHENRRIWRLEQQLLRWEAIGFAAGSIALEKATVIAELRGEAPPSRAEIDRLIIDRARTRWTDANRTAFDPPSLPDTEE